MMRAIQQQKHTKPRLSRVISNSLIDQTQQDNIQRGLFSDRLTSPMKLMREARAIGFVRV